MDVIFSSVTYSVYFRTLAKTFFFHIEMNIAHHYDYTRVTDTGFLQRISCRVLLCQMDPIRIIDSVSLTTFVSVCVLTRFFLPLVRVSPIMHDIFHEFQHARQIMISELFFDVQTNPVHPLYDLSEKKTYARHWWSYPLLTQSFWTVVKSTNMTHRFRFCVFTSETTWDINMEQ